ncbi:MAG: bifunctional [glutamine synthetase] adenylyltransferase/[glutamine synthetase]-adenylyl-L-tyrosine phosphorylase [Pseudomonadota bacterium]
MAPLTQRITRHPIAIDPDLAASTLAPLEPSLRQEALGAVLHGTAGTSSYLRKLITRHADWLAEVAAAPPEDTLTAVLSEVTTTLRGADRQADVAKTLRHAKTRAALLIAIADLGGVWSLAEVTGALTTLADHLVGETARWLLAQEIAQNRLPGLGDADLESGAGYVILAMGKMGAGELNYSSDIDLIALFDDARFGHDDVLDARARYIHVTKQLVKLLSETAAGGYAFRTDLRLRPSPSTTPVCMAIDAAERYYESVGRTWERAAHIKARALVDTAAGTAYLKALVPFIWRRHMDFAAIEDTHEMLRKIRAQKAQFTPGALPGHNLKLGPGGIRTIEFFAQTRQLIVGGRDPSLRAPTTIGALASLTDADWIAPDLRDRLGDHYTALRTAEHRLQMLEDAQTHSVPQSEEARARFAALCGAPDRAAFEADLAARLSEVHALCEEFFTPGRSTAPAADPLAASEANLGEAGFSRPGDAARRIARWHEGQIPATRGDRARTLYLGLEPQIVARLSGAQDPDLALTYFDRFISGMPAGVQVFSLFTANPNLLDLIIEICVAAPRLANYLGRHSQMLDALVERDFWTLPDTGTLASGLATHLAADPDYQSVLDALRRWAREQWFRAGVHVLRALADERAAGAAFSGIAATSLQLLYPHVIDEFARRHGPPPGGGMAVLAMGKLGSAEMTAASDLDLITIYDAPGDAMSDGPRPLMARQYYPRLTQALVAALTAPTAEGTLYEVDMRLRPSGRAGPVAVSLTGFEAYQTTEAWVWEHMALTRSTVVAGPETLATAIGEITADVLARRVGTPEVMNEAVEMRTRLFEAKAAARGNPWSLKHAAGGLMEIEFLSQAGALQTGLAPGQRTADVVSALGHAGWITPADAEALTDALVFQQRLQQIERVALETELSPEAGCPELRQVIARAVGTDNFEEAAARLTDLQTRTATICAERFAAATPEA